jgi:hypothetical protein
MQPGGPRADQVKPRTWARRAAPESALWAARKVRVESRQEPAETALSVSISYRLMGLLPVARRSPSSPPRAAAWVGPLPSRRGPRGHRRRIHVQRTWSESGGRVERCKDGEDRWVTVPVSTIRGTAGSLGSDGPRSDGQRVDARAAPADLPQFGRRHYTATGLSSSSSGSPSCAPLPSPSGSRTQCGIATPHGSSRPAQTSAGSRIRWATHRSRR